MQNQNHDLSYLTRSRTFVGKEDRKKTRTCDSDAIFKIDLRLPSQRKQPSTVDMIANIVILPIWNKLEHLITPKGQQKVSYNVCKPLGYHVEKTTTSDRSQYFMFHVAEVKKSKQLPSHLEVGKFVLRSDIIHLPCMPNKVVLAEQNKSYNVAIRYSVFC